MAQFTRTPAPRALPAVPGVEITYVGKHRRRGGVDVRAALDAKFRGLQRDDDQKDRDHDAQSDANFLEHEPRIPRSRETENSQSAYSMACNMNG